MSCAIVGRFWATHDRFKIAFAREISSRRAAIRGLGLRKCAFWCAVFGRMRQKKVQPIDRWYNLPSATNFRLARDDQKKQFFDRSRKKISYRGARLDLLVGVSENRLFGAPFSVERDRGRSQLTTRRIIQPPEAVFGPAGTRKMHPFLTDGNYVDRSARCMPSLNHFFHTFAFAANIN